MNDINETDNRLLWLNGFLTSLKMNLSKEDYETLTFLICKAQKHMLNKRFGVSNAQVEDALIDLKEKGE